MTRIHLGKLVFAILFIMAAASVFAPRSQGQATIKTLLTFNGTESEANLTFDSAGNLYGTTGDQYDPSLITVFELSPNAEGTWTENVLWTSAGGTEPLNIRAGVIFDASGNLYGTSLYGGASGCGTVFKLTREASGSWPESNLFDFNCGSQGNFPVGGLAFDSAGNLYGTTSLGGAYGAGVVFELKPGAGGQWYEKILHDFTTGSDGGWPGHEALILDSQGALYGTASQGAQGPCVIWDTGCGVVFQLTPKENGSWTYKVIHSFTGGDDGGVPEASLIFDKAGNLYGTTYIGGTHGYGVTFELIPHSNGTWSERVLHQFGGGEDGNGPFGGVIFDSAGNLYGTTAYGGDDQCGLAGNPIGCGIVYKLTPTSTGATENVLFRFHGAPNDTPYNSLVMDSLGNLYGVGAGYDMDASGSVYEVTP
jgi:uncharacterized repeat protein (TIGR03803 family)